MRAGKFLALLTILIIFLLYWNIDLKGQSVKCLKKRSSWPLLNTRLDLLSDTSCEKGTLLIILVTSHADHVSLRGQLRDLVPSSDLEKLGMRRVFLLGRSKGTRKDNNFICEEQKTFGDLVVGDFEESYRKLSLKHVMGLRWALELCGKVKLVLKQDDDILVDYYQLWTILNSTSSSLRRGQVSALEKFRRELRALKGNFILGKPLVNMKVIRDKTSKWFVSLPEYPEEFYPNFVSGWAYLTTIGTLRVLISNSRAEYFWIDDVYVTGTLRERAGVGIVDMSPVFTHYKGHLLCCFKGPYSSGGPYNRGPFNNKLGPLNNKRGSLNNKRGPSNNKRGPSNNKSGPSKGLYWCDFLVGPSMDDENLRRTFYYHAKFCHESGNCTLRPAGFDVNRTCVVTPDLMRGLERSNKGPKSVLKRITL